MATQENPPIAQMTPQVPIHFVPATVGETFKLGTLTIRIMEDGSRTGMQDNKTHSQHPLNLFRRQSHRRS